MVGSVSGKRDESWARDETIVDFSASAGGIRAGT